MVEPFPVEGFAKDFRERVRKYHEERKARPPLAKGLVVEYGRFKYRLDEPAGPRRGWHVKQMSVNAQGELMPVASYRMTARQLSQARRLSPEQEAQAQS
jgi:hypothetical protein